MQQIKDVMTQDVKILSPDTTIKDAARQMRDGDFGLMPVGDNDRLVGTLSDRDARTEWHSLQRLLAEIPGEATVWPGHDYGSRPSSTMALEKATNPFLLCRDLDAFLDLKANWASFKKTHGLR